MSQQPWPRQKFQLRFFPRTFSKSSEVLTLRRKFDEEHPEHQRLFLEPLIPAPMVECWFHPWKTYFYNPFVPTPLYLLGIWEEKRVGLRDWKIQRKRACSPKFVKVCPMTSQTCAASWDFCECFDSPSKGKGSREGKLRNMVERGSTQV
jgi:hypothetical protein